MAIDYAEKEREFLESLAEDTGRDLGGWMAAIAETGLTERNTIIDWLRQQGFLFARASWLERIHHNGGRPIYLDAGSLGAGPARVDRPPPQPSAAITPPQPVAHLRPMTGSAAQPAPVAQAAVTETAEPEGSTVGPVAAPVKAKEPPDVGAVLAEAKGYRPLAQLVLREIEKAAPHATFAACDGYVAIAGATGLAGVLTVTAKELRLALAAPGVALPAPFVKARFAKTHPGVPAEISHMVILTDARQVTPDLIQAWRGASVRLDPALRDETAITI